MDINRINEKKDLYQRGKKSIDMVSLFSYEKVILEESVSTKIGNGTITSAIGMEKENNNGWTPCPVPVYEAEVEEIPQIEDSGIDWETVVFVTGGLLFAGGILCAIPTGGASLGLCVL